jgi:hypothetical protein
MLPGRGAPLRLGSATHAARRDLIPGFEPAGEPLAPAAFPPPRIPRDYEPRHEFADDLVPGKLFFILLRCMLYIKNTFLDCACDNRVLWAGPRLEITPEDMPPCGQEDGQQLTQTTMPFEGPPMRCMRAQLFRGRACAGAAAAARQQAGPAAAEVAPPENGDLRRTIEAMAPFVARNGPAFEALAAKLNAGKPAFAFLAGGAGAEYYRWRVQARGCRIPYPINRCVGFTGCCSILLIC